MQRVDCRKCGGAVLSQAGAMGSVPGHPVAASGPSLLGCQSRNLPPHRRREAPGIARKGLGTGVVQKSESSLPSATRVQKRVW